MVRGLVHATHLLFLCVRDPKAMAQMDGLRSPCGPLFVPGSAGQIYFCSKVVPMSWISATGVIRHVHRRLLTSPLHHLRCLEPAVEVRCDRRLPLVNLSTISSVELLCPTRGRVSTAAIGQNELHVGRAPLTPRGNSSFGVTRFEYLKLDPSTSREAVR